jgi:hypothetical protein
VVSDPGPPVDLFVDSQTATTVVGLAAPRTLPDQLLVLSSSGALSLSSEADLSVIASLRPSASEPLAQSLNVYQLTPTSSFVPAAIHSLVSTASHAHLAFVVRSFPAPITAPSLVEISKKTFKKMKRPSSAAVIDAADREGSDANQNLSSEIEVILVDPSVVRDGEPSVGIVSLGSVRVPGTQVGVSEDGFVSALGTVLFFPARVD